MTVSAAADQVGVMVPCATSGGGLQQLGVLGHGRADRLGLRCGQRPIAGFHRFRQAGKFQVGIGIASRVEHVPEPGTSRNARWIQPVRLDAEQLGVDTPNLARSSVPGRKVREYGVSQLLSGRPKFRNAPLEARKLAVRPDQSCWRCCSSSRKVRKAAPLAAKSNGSMSEFARRSATTPQIRVSAAW